MIPLDHNEGINPELKHILHILCNIQTAAVSLNNSTGNLSTPGAFPFLVLFKTLMISSNVISQSKLSS
jgi:hypothetical protein